MEFSPQASLRRGGAFAEAGRRATAYQELSAEFRQILHAVNRGASMRVRPESGAHSTLLVGKTVMRCVVGCS
ncbi:hypothetical protein PLANPX_1488 [Lacipirellula parvula]|uniref:Uncharacterized protein n=1 Tax=Lacipirellula parvula TaxID=2650471 RepID=A0A5K7XC08_9BACT|nr:hypothetical protein PLANPX_1488 [Lacipirellula parvula]